jgi:hypothetical protein
MNPIQKKQNYKNKESTAKPIKKEIIKSRRKIIRRKQRSNDYAHPVFAKLSTVLVVGYCKYNYSKVIVSYNLTATELYVTRHLAFDLCAFVSV